jgi:hypothetical protein
VKKVEVEDLKDRQQYLLHRAWGPKLSHKKHIWRQGRWEEGEDGAEGRFHIDEALMGNGWCDKNWADDIYEVEA